MLVCVCLRAVSKFKFVNVKFHMTPTTPVVRRMRASKV